MNASFYSKILVGLVFATLTACASSEPTPARAPESSSPQPQATLVGNNSFTMAHTPKKPMCEPGSPNEPSDVRASMRNLNTKISRCWLLGGHQSNSRTMRVELTVHEDGQVTDVTIQNKNDLKNQEAVRCSEQTFRRASFSKFCGDDVSLQWSYYVE
jgi:transglutaminase/protease-like cytokinesis protein 3